MRQGRLHAVVMWVGHFYDVLLVAMLAVAQGNAVLAGFLDGTSPVLGSAGRAADMVVPVAMYLVFLARLYHNRHLCLRDVVEAPWTDPEVKEAKSVRQLRLFHWYTAAWYRFVAVMGMIFAVGWSSWAIRGVVERGVVGLWSGPSRSVGWAVVDSSMLVVAVLMAAYVFRLGWLHQRLQPWCRFCREGGGGHFQVGPAGPVDRRSPTPA